MNSTTSIDAIIERNFKFNFIVNFLDGAFFWFGVSFIAYRTILPVYIANLTDSEFAIALLSVILTTGWLLPQLFTANWTQQLPIKKYAPVNIGIWTERLPALLLVPSAWLATISTDLALIASMICIAWHIIGAGVIAVGWQDMMAKIFPVDRRGKFFGFTNFGGTATGVMGAYTVGWLLDNYEFPYSYVWSFLIGGICISISWIFISLTKEPPVEPKSEPVSNRDYWKKLPQVIKSDSNFRRYLIAQIFTGAGNMAIGFLAVYAVRRWNLPDSQAGRFTMAMLVGQASGNLVFGWLSDRKGHKLSLEICVLITAIGSGIAALASQDFWFYPVFFLIGISLAGTMLSGIMIVFEFCGPDIRPTYIGITNTFRGLVAIFMPLIGGLLAKSLGYQTMFGVTFAICLFGLFLLRVWVKEPRFFANQQ
jgi:MFS family permease